MCGSATKFLYIARMCVFLYILYSVYCDFHATEHKRVAFFFLFFFLGGGGVVVLRQNSCKYLECVYFHIFYIQFAVVSVQLKTKSSLFVCLCVCVCVCVRQNSCK